MILFNEAMKSIQDANLISRMHPQISHDNLSQQTRVCQSSHLCVCGRKQDIFESLESEKHDII